jgi:hypothetical protein
MTYFGVLSDALGATICALVLLAALVVSSAASLPPPPRTVRPLFFAGRSSRVCICGILSIQLLLKKLSPVYFGSGSLFPSSGQGKMICQISITRFDVLCNILGHKLTMRNDIWEEIYATKTIGSALVTSHVDER